MKNTIMKNFGRVAAVLTAISLLTACAREISPDVYNAATVGEASTTHTGVIINARNVTVAGSENLQDNGLGIIGGGAAGAYAGSQFGKGEGNTLATIGGAIAGATAGAFAEKALKKQAGTEYTVQLDNGQIMTVVQGPSPALTVGQNVYVIVAKERTHDGHGQVSRSRVVAR